SPIFIFLRKKFHFGACLAVSRRSVETVRHLLGLSLGGWPSLFRLQSNGTFHPDALGQNNPLANKEFSSLSRCPRPRARKAGQLRRGASPGANPFDRPVSRILQRSVRKYLIA